MALITDKFVFIHVPRTGGMFFRDVVSRLGIPAREHGDPRTPNRIQFHQPLPEIPAEILRDKLTFGFVRHPLTWLISRWQFDHAGRSADLSSNGTAGYMSPFWGEFISDVVNRCPDAPTKEMLGLVEGAARIFKYEDLTESISTVLAELGYSASLSFVQSIPKKNASHDCIPDHPFSGDQLRCIMEANHGFCERFGYQ